jgi:hypothetical protein
VPRDPWRIIQFVSLLIRLLSTVITMLTTTSE